MELSGEVALLCLLIILMGNVHGYVFQNPCVIIIKLFESEVGHKCRFEYPVSRRGMFVRGREGDIPSRGVGRLVLELRLRACIDLCHPAPASYSHCK
jgi:hypothetical protein